MFRFFSTVLMLAALFAGTNTALAASQNNEYHFTVKPGDSLSKYFYKTGLSSRLLANLLSASRQNKQLNYLKIGEKIIIKLHANKRFKSLSHLSRNQAIFNVSLVDNRFFNSSKKPQKRIRALSTTRVTINRSFGYDAQKAGLSLSTISAVVEALSWGLNFNSDLRKGDRFFIVSDGSKNPAGIIYKSANKRIEAFSYQAVRGHNKYYDRHGYTLNASFLKAPLKYKRISSKFQLKRFHPILKTYRPHRAVDYAADYGTPVHSTADGIVKFKNYKGALGKVIILQHGANYTTVYAHLSSYARSLHKGKAVKKGQIIGYVGSTGRSTGNHLHYELRYKGERKNPLTHKLPKQQKISADELGRFRAQVNEILDSL